jgi:hypothetical protein
MGLFGRRRCVPGNGRQVTAVIFEPDRWAIQAASLGAATNTISPMSVGRHSPGASVIGFVGDRGYGVNRWAGADPRAQGTRQNLAAPSAPVRNPRNKLLGIGAGVSGQPGYPSTGQDNSGVAQMAYLGYGQLAMHTGLGG